MHVCAAVSLPCAAESPGQFLLDSVCWVAPNSMVASGLFYDADDDMEADDAYQMGITWSSWAGVEQAAPDGLEARQISFYDLPVSTRNIAGYL
jgi:hypothetical protein